MISMAQSMMWHRHAHLPGAEIMGGRDKPGHDVQGRGERDAERRSGL
jgi:hypothetical protein